jgi:hypothetical protein
VRTHFIIPSFLIPPFIISPFIIPSHPSIWLYSVLVLTYFRFFTENSPETYLILLFLWGNCLVCYTLHTTKQSDHCLSWYSITPLSFMYSSLDHIFILPFFFFCECKDRISIWLYYSDSLWNTGW